MNKGLIILLVVVLLVGGYFWSFYNGLVKQDQAITAQWAQVENQFQRRFDLIPNLVSSVQGAMTQEQKVFSDITDARTKYAGAQSTDQKVAATEELSGALGRLLAVIENYPTLKSIDAVQQMMAQIEGTENRVAVERGRFNELTRDYNTHVTTLPGKFIALMFDFSAKSYFEATGGAENVPKVEL